MAKLFLIINDPLPVLLGNEQELGHENLVNTYLFYQVCKVHDILCFGDQFPNDREVMTAYFQTFLPKTGVLDDNFIITKSLPKTGVLDDNFIITKSLPNLCQIFDKNLIGTPV